MRAEAHPPRRIWPIVLVLVVVCAGIAAVILTRQPAPPSAAPTPTSSSSSTLEPLVPSSVTGCLGGPGLDLAMLTATQEKAGHSVAGAVEFIASVQRWLVRYPMMSPEEAAAGLEEIASKSAAEGVYRLPEEVGAVNADPSAGTLPLGTPFHLNNVAGTWEVRSIDGDTVTATVFASVVIDGAIQSQYIGVIYTVAWEGGRWKVVHSTPFSSDEDRLVDGTPFAGGC